MQKYCKECNEYVDEDQPPCGNPDCPQEPEDPYADGIQPLDFETDNEKHKNQIEQNLILDV